MCLILPQESKLPTQCKLIRLVAFLKGFASHEPQHTPYTLQPKTYLHYTKLDQNID